MSYRFIIVFMALLAVGCSDPKAANEKNFKAAIQKSLDSSYPKCYYTKNFPATVPIFFGAGENKAVFKALVDAGILEEKVESHMSTEYQIKRMVTEPTFYLTAEGGKKFYKNNVSKSVLGEETGGFCFGKATVKDIVQFTEPGDMMGGKYSTATYKYVVGDFPSWAKRPEILAVIADLKKDVESEVSLVEGSALLNLTNKGWIAVN
jgi:hypothetical protein